MYRLAIPVVLLLAVAGAPQEPNRSGETYVKIEPVNETTFQNLTPDIPSDPVQEFETTGFDRHVRSDDFTTELDQPDVTTDIADAAEADAVQPAVEVKTRSRSPSPRFTSKLSYFQKPTYAAPSLANIIERNGKRNYKTTCRCEKIWNCPKLQITVPRCPNEYFLCCL